MLQYMMQSIPLRRHTSGVSTQSIGDGKELGIAAAQAIIQNRQEDGYNDNTSYTPGNQPGDWRLKDTNPAVEDGLTEPFAEFFSQSGSGVIQGTIFDSSARPIAPIAPGQTTSLTLTFDKRINANLITIIPKK
jgi:hypothetical protein